MYNFCDICLIYKLVKKFDRFQETIDLCEEQTDIRIAFFVCMNSCEVCHIYRKTDKQETNPDQVRKSACW